MRFDTQGVVVEADMAHVVGFVGEGANLPRWAIGFAREVVEGEDGWVVVTASGQRVPTRIEADPDKGVVDFVMTPMPGMTVTAWSRSVPAPGGTLFTFTQVQPPGMPDDVFDAQVRALAHELATLKALLEVSCPL